MLFTLIQKLLQSWGPFILMTAHDFILEFMLRGENGVLT